MKIRIPKLKKISRGISSHGMVCRQRQHHNVIPKVSISCAIVYTRPPLTAWVSATAVDVDQGRLQSGVPGAKRQSRKRWLTSEINK